MARTTSQDSRATFSGGIHGMIAGAAAGAVLMVLASLLLDNLLRIGSGGPGLHAMAGAAVGGMAGFLVGALRSRRGGRAVP